ncbi:hypothetical protein [Microbulbifer yueqingensis]|uniref:Lipoprotein n=1 Tax=Microbulbifer yueqingensis TaxID=658219 RepID=A0A1G9CD12_9GAMM|nr:hypothetical protein [Microbulbifer yueqingensis]SDK49578.1 hypothetical protein SAMN05216212_2468 [Microbulbifer yueqingensis]
MKVTAIFRRLAVGCLIILFAGASQASGCASNPKLAKASGPVNNDESGDRHASAKPGIPVSVAYELEGSPAVGKPLRLTVKLASGIDSDSLRVRVLPEPGLLLLDASDSANFGPVKRRERREFRVSFIPQREGAFRIRLAFALDQQGVGQSGMFTIPVSIGPDAARGSPELPQGAKMGADEEGRPLIVFPAESR